MKDRPVRRNRSKGQRNPDNPTEMKKEEGRNIDF